MKGSVRETYTVPDGNSNGSYSRKISVKTFKLHVGADATTGISEDGGWITECKMKTIDQFGGDIPVLNAFGSNEAFSDYEDLLYAGENWTWPRPNGGPLLSWTDKVSMPAALTTFPTPLNNPNDSMASIVVDRATQTWRYGSETPGEGDNFVENTGVLKLQRNLGFAKHSRP